RMQLHFNGQLIDLLHVGPGHTAGDAAVIFRDRNAVHMGDLFLPQGYPFVDVDNGGSIDGLIAFCRAVLAELNDDAVVIPGPGPIAAYADLAHLTQMLPSVPDGVAAPTANGPTPAPVLAAQPAAG